MSGLPVETVDVNETGALGCAIAAAAAVGGEESVEAAARRMCPAGGRFEPDPEAGRSYARRYALYRHAIECLDPLWDEMQACVEGR